MKGEPHIARLEHMAAHPTGDTEREHATADAVLLNLLSCYMPEADWRRARDAYVAIDKWYG